MPLIFQLEAHGGRSAAPILDELRVVFPRQLGKPMRALVQLPYGLNLQMDAWEPPPTAGIRLRCIGAALDTDTEVCGYGNMLAQDLFCRLERLGLQVRYRVEWQAV
jgi:hypothetical protein